MVKPGFTRAELSEARVRRAEKSIFAECQLVSTNFEEAILAGASFEGAHAPRSVWSDADLRDANLARLHAEGATFRNASLAGRTRYRFFWRVAFSSVLC